MDTSELSLSAEQHDKMLQRVYEGLNKDVFTITKTPDPIVYIENLEEYNVEEGLALSSEEIDYLKGLSEKLGRKLTDSEVFGFSQVNSEHCRHKIFNGTFIIDGEEKEFFNPTYWQNTVNNLYCFTQGIGSNEYLWTSTNKGRNSTTAISELSLSLTSIIIAGISSLPVLRKSCCT